MTTVLIESTSVEDPANGDMVNGFVRLTNRKNSDKWSVYWSIGAMDNIYSLSESLAGKPEDMDVVVNFLNSQSKKFPNLSGSLRWGGGEGLNFSTAYRLGVILVTWWNINIRKWASNSMAMK